MKLRCLSDIRQLPLTIGMIQCMWALVPALQIKGSRFYVLLQSVNLDNQWGWMMMLTGLYLIFGAFVKRRDTLTIALLLSATVWTIMSIIFADAAWRSTAYVYNSETLAIWATPVTLSMPVIALSLWFALFRELIAQPVVITERRRFERRA